MFGDRKHNWTVNYSKALELVFPQQLGHWAIPAFDEIWLQVNTLTQEPHSTLFSQTFVQNYFRESKNYFSSFSPSQKVSSFWNLLKISVLWELNSYWTHILLAFCICEFCISMNNRKPPCYTISYKESKHLQILISLEILKPIPHRYWRMAVLLHVSMSCTHILLHMSMSTLYHPTLFPSWSCLDYLAL